MCGIVGYVGRRNAADRLIDGLKALEYRGYDSAGIAVFDQSGKINVVKRAGYVCKLQKAVGNVKGVCGIGHTRWATHGAPDKINAHPHTSGRITLVHNGIIENFAELKDELQKKGAKFVSQTDSEVAAAFIDSVFDGDGVAALCCALAKLRGSFAIAMLCEGQTDKIFAVAKNSPLVLGLGKDEFFAASDAQAFCGLADSVVVMKDGEIAEICANGVRIFDSKGRSVPLRKEKAAERSVAPTCRGSRMLAEIFEAPKALEDTAKAFFGTSVQKQVVDIFSKNDKVVMLGCGTAYHACLIGKNLFESVLGVPVEAELASEYRYKKPLTDDKTAVVAVSQSGETADTIAAAKLAKARGADLIVITNAAGSALTRIADVTVETKAGAEVAVAATKSYLAQAEVFLCFVTALSKDMKAANEIKKEIFALPQLARRALALQDQVKRAARKFRKKKAVFFIGRGLDFALAQESALKFKEVTYIHSEGFAAGELKHGTLALVDKNTLTCAFITQRHVADKTLNALHEVRSRGGHTLVIGVDEKGDGAITLPKAGSLFAPFAAAIVMQMFACFASEARGIDPDRPKNLAKSVTVE